VVSKYIPALLSLVIVIIAAAAGAAVPVFKTKGTAQDHENKEGKESGFRQELLHRMWKGANAKIKVL
jgi:hypothetical protein